jgi:hypothetical protein
MAIDSLLRKLGKTFHNLVLRHAPSVRRSSVKTRRPPICAGWVPRRRRRARQRLSRKAGHLEYQVLSKRYVLAKGVLSPRVRWAKRERVCRGVRAWKVEEPAACIGAREL